MFVKSLWLSLTDDWLSVSHIFLNLEMKSSCSRRCLFSLSRYYSASQIHPTFWHLFSFSLQYHSYSMTLLVTLFTLETMTSRQLEETKQNTIRKQTSRKIQDSNQETRWLRSLVIFRLYQRCLWNKGETSPVDVVILFLIRIMDFTRYLFSDCFLFDIAQSFLMRSFFRRGKTIEFFLGRISLLLF